MMDYATDHWPNHVRQSGVGSNELANLWKKFVSPLSSVLYAKSASSVSKRRGWMRGSAEHSTISVPLLAACYYQLEPIFEWLLGRETSPNCPNYAWETLLHLAAKNGNLHIVQLLLSKVEVDVNKRDKYHYHPLSRAAREGHEKVVEMLLAVEGVNVNNTDISGNTPLSWAAREEHEKVVEMLLAVEGVHVNNIDIY